MASQHQTTSSKILLHFTSDPRSKLFSASCPAPATRPRDKVDLTDALDHADCVRLRVTLAEDRTVELYHNFTRSVGHCERMRRMPYSLRHPREVWRSHPHWRLNKQMTAYHVPIRLRMQRVLDLLAEAYRGSEAGDAAALRRGVGRASKMFELCMLVLEGHAEKEETSTFPMLARRFPDIDVLSFYDTHRHLLEYEESVRAQFRGALEEGGAPLGHPAVSELIRKALGFDELLLQHLGEEEELVVPMYLEEPDANHENYPFSPETVPATTMLEDFYSNFTADKNSPIRRARVSEIANSRSKL